MYFQSGHTPGVDLVFIQFHEVIVIRQTFAKATEGKAPWAWTTERFLEFGSEAGLRDTTHPAFAVRAALKTVSTHEIGIFRLHITKTRHVNAIRSSADFQMIFKSWNGC